MNERQLSVPGPAKGDADPHETPPGGSAQAAPQPATLLTTPPDTAPPPVKSTSVRRAWSRTDVNFWLDSSLLLVFLSLVGVATIIEFIFPPATVAAGWTLWSWTLDQWLATQFALLAVLTFGVLIHLMLHWSWVCGVFFGRVWRSPRRKTLPDDGTRTIYGVGLMILLLNALGLLVAAAALSIQSPL